MRVRAAAVLVVAASAPGIGFASATATASADSPATLRESIDHVAQQWFDAQADLQKLDANIAADEQRINALSKRAHALQLEATERAVDMYVGRPTRFVEVFNTDTAIDSARRVELIERANDKSTQTFNALSDLLRHLRADRDALSKERDAKRDAVNALATSRADLDAQLRTARVEAERAVRARAELAASRSARTTAANGGSSRAASPTPDPAPAQAVIAAPPSRGVFPMHEHPFLVCTRNRESRGVYTVVSSSGLYYGAYQFLRTTWDVTAIHAGRSDLVGVRPNTASEYDQDDLAWTLYQWQGNSPWGGRC
jgi:peptidoglycan hydrolase CwlO-like protein